MSGIVVLPILAPLVSGVLALLAHRAPRAQRWLGVAGGLAHLVAAAALLRAVARHGILAVQMGAWPAPFGITLVADHFSALMTLVAAILGLAVSIYALADTDPIHEAFGYHPIYHMLLAGVTGAFLTGDVFNLYVWFEVMLIASFVLLTLGGSRAQLDGAVKYVVLNLVSSIFFLAGIGLLYGVAGTLNMAHLAMLLPEAPAPALITAISMLFMVAFGIKAAVFPLFLWLPVSYHTPPVAVSAIFAGLLTKVGVYALIRVFTLLFTAEVAFTHAILLVVAGLTMVVGVLGAAAQNEVRRLLAFHIVSQIGYMIMGLALFTPLALLGAVLYTMHNILAKANLFLISGVMHRLRGSFELDRLGGLWRTHPFLGVLFLVSALSLAGIPPLTGFWAKLILVRAGLEAGRYAIVLAALAVGLLTLYSMTKIWGGAFWKPEPHEGQASHPGPSSIRPGHAAPGGVSVRVLMIPVIGLAGIILIFGLWPQPLMNLLGAAAAELMDPDLYIDAVLGVVR